MMRRTTPARSVKFEEEDEMSDRGVSEVGWNRRKFLAAASTGVVGSTVAGSASAETLADVPAREPGADLGAFSARSKYVQIGRIPEAGPGHRNVDPADAINSKAPLQKLVGGITPSDLHYERSHSGAPDLDPSKHRLLVHGMVRKQLVFSVEDLKAMPAVSRIAFLECTGNGWENWKKADGNLTVQNTHGLVSTNEWTGVPLKFILGLVTKDPASTWMLAEGGDAAGVARSVPLTEEIVDEAIVAYGQNGEPIRPAHGFPIRLILPGMEGN
ncbi:molybdopterin-dependent oxidoreductase [Bradyrhizobium canariense]|uniref:molybdopterin-dependent oxidoreductase n=1 Tax=Bradyrhizobium canariense TaxID=255045 RepID=UPI001FD9A5FD|nr:molybdopterin-dependent oxidoreductase [Bradyrhizobium canariense]